MEFNLENLSSEEKETLQTLLNKLQEPSVNIKSQNDINYSKLQSFLKEQDHEYLTYFFSIILEKYDDYHYYNVNYKDFISYPCDGGDIYILFIDLNFEEEDQYSDTIVLKEEINNGIFEIDLYSNIFTFMGGISE